MTGVNQSNPAGANPAHIAGTDFIMIHLDLLDELGGDFYAALLFARIQFRAGTDGWWTATRAQVLADTRLTEAKFKRALQTLRDAGYVQTERVAAYDARLRYGVIIAAITEMVKTTATTAETTGPAAETSTSEMVKTAVSTSIKNSEEQKQEPPIVPNGFDEFYKAYPRKKQRGTAERAWVKAIKDTDPGVIIFGAVQFRQWCEAENKDAQFIPYPSSWLNGKGWLDERDPEPMTEHERRMEGHMALTRELAYNEIGYQHRKPFELEG